MLLPDLRQVGRSGTPAVRRWSSGARKGLLMVYWPPQTETWASSLPVRNLQLRIDNNILLALKAAPFDKKDIQLVPAVGSCVDSPSGRSTTRPFLRSLRWEAANEQLTDFYCLPVFPPHEGAPTMESPEGVLHWKCQRLSPVILPWALLLLTEARGLRTPKNLARSDRRLPFHFSRRHILQESSQESGKRLSIS
jgi:hypothetical protein